MIFPQLNSRHRGIIINAIEQIDEAHLTRILNDISRYAYTFTAEERQKLSNAVDRIHDRVHREHLKERLLITPGENIPSQRRSLSGDEALASLPAFLTSPEAPPEVYEDGLNTLVLRLVGSMDLDAGTMGRLSDPWIAPLFLNLATYIFNHQDMGGRKPADATEDDMWKAFHKLTNDINARLPNVLRDDPQKALKATETFKSYWHGGGGANDAGRLFRKAWDGWKKGDLDGALDLPADTPVSDPRFNGFIEITTAEEYAAFPEKKPGVITSITSDEAFDGAVITITQFDTRDGHRIVKRAVIDAKAHPEVAELARRDRDFIAQVQNGSFAIGDVTRMRFGGYAAPSGGSLPASYSPRDGLSPATRGLVDDWLARQYRSNEAYREELSIGARNGVWTMDQKKAMRDSGIFAGLPDVEAALSAPSEQDYENALNRFVTQALEHFRGKTKIGLEGDMAEDLRTILLYLVSYPDLFLSNERDRLTTVQMDLRDDLYGAAVNRILDRIDNLDTDNIWKMMLKKGFSDYAKSSEGKDRMRSMLER